MINFENDQDDYDGEQDKDNYNKLSKLMMTVMMMII